VSRYSDDEEDEDDYEDSERNSRRFIDSDEEEEGAKDNVAVETNENAKNPRGKLIEPLPKIDHSTMKYLPFKKSFYKETTSTKQLSEEEIHQLRNELEISITSSSYSSFSSSAFPVPISSFQQLSATFPPDLLKEIERQGYTKPTPIQSQALPLILSGYDIVGLAKTGSGKTLAYLLPMIIHILDQPQMKLGDGPIALILVPTRELVAQIISECKKFSKVYSIRQVGIYGGSGKYEMSKALKETSPEVVIATPGRLIEMIGKMKSTSLTRVSYCVLDEADRMFEMGFEYQIRSILTNIQPSKQLIMFSATMKRRIESFAKDSFTNGNDGSSGGVAGGYVRLSVGSVGKANDDIQQIIHIFPSVSSSSSGLPGSVAVEDDTAKWLWLASEIDEFSSKGKVLIFALNKATTELLKLKLQEFFNKRQLNIGVDCIHGDKDQYDRTMIMKRFNKKKPTIRTDDINLTVPLAKKGEAEIDILIATDLAARGLDVKDIRTVINYEIAKNLETYIHRIGRTGRMGIEGIQPGTAYTLLSSPKDASFACDLVYHLRSSNQPISEELQELAMKDYGKWNKMSFRSGIGGGGGGAGGGRGGGRNAGGGRGGGRGMSLGLGSANGGRAMTSHMMASDTSSKFNITLPKGIEEAFQKKAAGEQQQPVFVGDKRPIGSLSSSSSSAAQSSKVLPGFVWSSNNLSSVSTGPSSTSSSISNNPLMRNFVKSSTDYSSVNSGNASSSASSNQQVRKKTRWG
jgi:ATP-dependent RNA helicase DDX42